MLKKRWSMHLLTTELSASLSEDSRVCSMLVPSSWSLGAASLVLLLPVSALAWRWRFFRLSFRVWMMSFTFPHGVLCAFWWGSFPVPVLPTPSYTWHHILHRHAYRKAKATTTTTTTNIPNQQVNLSSECSSSHCLKIVAEQKSFYIFTDSWIINELPPTTGQCLTTCSKNCVLLHNHVVCYGRHKFPPFYPILTFWRRIFFQILAHPVCKMWVIQKPNKIALWNKRHFEEKKMLIIQHV